MRDIADIFATMVNGLGWPYFLIALLILAACVLLWLPIRRCVHDTRAQRATVSLLLALSFAPSIFGFDLGAVTVPALFVIALALTGGLRLIALCWSAVSIAALWAFIFAIWSLVFRHRARQKNHVA